jgi:glycosyltransferase involved in cell wall biosynthesis
LVTLLPSQFPGDEVLAFTARHSRAEIDHVSPGAVRLPVPRPVLYEAWNTFGAPRLEWLSPSLGAADVVHAPSVAVPPRGRAPLVVTVHDVAPLLYPAAFPAHGRWFHARGLAAAARRADLVITVSQSARAEIVAHTAIPGDRIRVVPNGVDHVAAGAGEVAAAVARHGLEGAPYVLWVGTVEPRKDVATLVRAVARLSGSARLVLAGPSGWLSEGLLPQPEVDLLGDRLRRLGPVDNAELRALYAGATVFALPSRHEGFGLPVLEAMAQGTPVLCSAIPSLREVAGGAARLAPVGDVDGWASALQDLLADDQVRAALAAAGLARSAEFSWARTVAGTRAVYVEALGGDL